MLYEFKVAMRHHHDLDNWAAEMLQWPIFSSNDLSRKCN